MDKSRIENKLANLENQLKSLQEKQSIPMGEYQKEGDLQAVVERRLQNSIQACIDIGMHIITEEGSRKPESYADIFTILEEMKVLDTKLSNKVNYSHQTSFGVSFLRVLPTRIRETFVLRSAVSSGEL